MELSYIYLKLFGMFHLFPLSNQLYQSLMGSFFFTHSSMIGGKQHNQLIGGYHTNTSATASDVNKTKRSKNKDCTYRAFYICSG